MFITILLPCLNEEKVIGSCVDDAYEALHENHIDGDVLVCDNGSADASIQIALEHGAFVTIDPREGIGYWLRRGIEVADGDYIVYVDNLYDYDFRDLAKFKKACEQDFDFVNGNRVHKGIAMPGVYRRLTRVLARVTHAHYHCTYYDSACGFRAIKKSCFKDVPLATTNDIAVELLRVAEDRCHTVTDVEVSYKKGRYTFDDYLSVLSNILYVLAH